MLVMGCLLENGLLGLSCIDVLRIVVTGGIYSGLVIRCSFYWFLRQYTKTKSYGACQ